MGLSRGSPLATVRIPHPENEVSSVRVVATRRACSAVAIPAKRQCPAFELRTRQGCFFPSRARTYVERSSHQNASSNRRRSASAWLDNSRDRPTSPRIFASSPAAVLRHRRKPVLHTKRLVLQQWCRPGEKSRHTN